MSSPASAGTDGKPVTCMVIGGGNRGYGYSKYAKAFPAEFKIVGVAEPRDFHRQRLQDEHQIPQGSVFKDWRDAANKDKFADCVIIATPDREHKGPAIALAKKGYRILLEKPMAVTEEECREIVTACKENNTLLAVCHVLRYSPWAKKLKEIIDSGEIGDVVGYWHFAHSFVRGNWRNESESACSLLTKCCHDVDLLCHWMSPQKCIRVSSFGSVSHFKKSDKPKDAGDRCMDCKIERDCPYSAQKLYLERVKQGHVGWPLKVVAEVPDIESVTDALKNGPYGRCVYECDNDVMSHQVTNMQFDNGATASLTMVAFSSRNCEREVKVYGTKGEITCDAENLPKLKVFNFLTDSTREVECRSESAGLLGRHGGADYHLMRSFVGALRSGSRELIQTGADETLASHLLVFAADKARKENRVVEVQKDGSF
ncbi:hypothetical protein BaRGS_00010785 [Batillaria attramentaria]|uniref:Oxidoreductase n=1 Tax=Batillaria attramentaria TaxID=370345 RepID=A0ABD0LEP3_9CAEN